MELRAKRQAKMSTAKKPKQKRRWPYSFDYEYKDEDRGITYGFTVNADILWYPPEPDVGQMSGYFDDFDYEIASFDRVIVQNGHLHNSEPWMEFDIVIPETESDYRTWFIENRVGKFVEEKIEELTIEEFKSAHNPDYDF